MEAAINVFAKQGFYQSTIAQVAKEAGVADGTIYLYFKSKDDILIQFLFEAAVLSLTGGAIGIIGGWLLSNLISRIDFGGITLAAAVSPDIVVLAISVSVIIGLVSGIYPAMRAARLNPIDALHYE